MYLSAHRICENILKEMICNEMKRKIHEGFLTNLQWSVVNSDWCKLVHIMGLALLVHLPVPGTSFKLNSQ